MNGYSKKTNTLPVCWQLSKFGAIISESQPGFACGQRDPNGVIQLRMNNVDTRGNLVWDEFLRVPADKETIERYCLKPGDIVFNNTNSTELVGKSAIFTGYPEAIVYSNHFTRLRVKGDLADPGFVTLWLISQWQARTFEILCNRWIGQSAVKSDKLFDLEIPLPPIAEQQRIASLLGEKIAVVEMVRQFAEEQLQAARKLPFAYLREQFSHPATNWYKVKLGQICEQDRKIIDPHSSLAKQTTYLSLEHVESITGRILREPTEQNHNEGLSTTFAFDSRHILYGKLRPYLNKVALPSFSGRCTTELIPILPKGVDKGFLAWILRRQETVDAVMQQKTGSRMPRANMEKLFSLEISLPPTDEQLRIASYLDEKITCSHNLEITLENQLTEINHMHTALLREAFTGDI